jgi:flagellar protein FlaG
MEINGLNNYNSTVIQKRVTNQNHLSQSKQQLTLPDKEVSNIAKTEVAEIEKKIEGVNQFLKSSNTNIKFNLHEELKEYYITIVDVETDEVIKEVPPKKLLDIYAAMIDTLGLFIDKKI